MSETIYDIVRDMRTLGRLDEKSIDKIPRSLQALVLRTYADRLEAALKREREATCEKSSQVGNAAKMREVCQKIFDILMSHGDGRTHCILTWDEFDDALMIIRDALTRPPRNCDTFSKAEVLEVLKDRSFSKEDTIEWLFEAEGESK